MTPTIITPNDEAHWLELRAEDITSTEVSALFNGCPYVTRFELYHRKHDGIVPDWHDNDRMMWGRELEAVIARRTAETLGIEIAPFKEYARHATVSRMGSSFDFSIVQHGMLTVNETTHTPTGPGLLECKNVDGLIYRQGWSDTEAPMHIEFQVQHQMEVADVNWCIIAALVGGNELKLIYRERDTTMGAGLCKAVEAFWKDVDTHAEPEPDMGRDSDYIISMYQNVGIEFIDLSGDEEARALAISYKHFTDLAKQFSDAKKGARAALLMKIGDAAKATIDEFEISATMVKGAHVEYDRDPYRGWKLTQSKVK